MNDIGFIGHGTSGYWFAGPLPSPKCARLLVQLHDGIDVDQIPADVRQRLNQKWQRQPGFFAMAKQYPNHARRVLWAINLESVNKEGPEVQVALEFINRLNVPVFTDVGPYFPEIRADVWTGESY